MKIQKSQPIESEHLRASSPFNNPIMTAANCSPAVASRRAKYDDDFRVPTLLDAQPLDLAARAFANAPRTMSTWQKYHSIFNIDMAIEP